MTEGISLIRAWLLWYKKMLWYPHQALTGNRVIGTLEPCICGTLEASAQNAPAEVEERDSLGELVMVMSWEITGNFL
jgi:hypothetical protein